MGSGSAAPKREKLSSHIKTRSLTLPRASFFSLHHTIPRNRFFLLPSASFLLAWPPPSPPLRDPWQRQMQPRQRLAVLTYSYVVARLQQDFDSGVVEKEGSVG